MHNSSNLFFANIKVYNALTGIYQNNSMNNTYYLNQLYSNAQNGIRLESSHNNEILSNLLWENNQSGINLTNSNSNTITSNYISNHLYGIYLLSSNGTIVTHNTGSNNSININENNCIENYFKDNFLIELDSRSNNTSKEKDEKVILKFTYILIISLIVISIALVVFKTIRFK